MRATTGRPVSDEPLSSRIPTSRCPVHLLGAWLLAARSSAPRLRTECPCRPAGAGNVQRTTPRPRASRVAPTQLKDVPCPYGACDFVRLGGCSSRGCPSRLCPWTEPSAFRSARELQGPGRRMRPGGSQRHHRWLRTTRTRQSPTGPERHYRWTPAKRIFTRGGRAPETDPTAYAKRHVVENGFERVKQWRALATRYDKLALTYRARASRH